jgi:hypothetical protein
VKTAAKLNLEPRGESTSDEIEIRTVGPEHDRTQGQYRSVPPHPTSFSVAYTCATGIACSRKCLPIRLVARCYHPSRGPSSIFPFRHVCVRTPYDRTSQFHTDTSEFPRPHSRWCLLVVRQRRPSSSHPPLNVPLPHSVRNWDPDLLIVIYSSSDSQLPPPLHHAREQGTNETVHDACPHITAPTWRAQVRRCARTTTPNALESIRRQRASSGRGKIGLERTDTRAAEWV